MPLTICSLIAALLVGFFAPAPELFYGAPLFFILTLGGALLLLATLFLNLFPFTSFVRLEQTLIPNLIHVLRDDFVIRWSSLGLFLFCFLYFVFAVLGLDFPPTYQKGVLLGWILSFGFCLDLLRIQWRRLARLLTPSYMVDYLANEVKKGIQNEQDPLVWTRLDNLAEMGLRAVENSQLALSTQVLQTFPSIMQVFLTSAKGIGHLEHDFKMERKMGTDEGSYAIFYLLQRLELIEDRALQNRLETVCRQMIMTMGKIIIAGARYDLSLVPFPTHFLTKFGLKAQQHHFDEVGELTTSTLLEIAKTIFTEIDLTYMELIEPFQTILNGLDALAKATFKKNKQMRIKTLIQPFLDMKDFFETEKMATHPDTPAIMGEINRLLEEYAILEEVMKTLPQVTAESGDRREE